MTNEWNEIARKRIEYIDLCWHSENGSNQSINNGKLTIFTPRPTKNMESLVAATQTASRLNRFKWTKCSHTKWNLNATKWLTAWEKK